MTRLDFSRSRLPALRHQGLGVDAAKVGKSNEKQRSAASAV
jgi:hypothetical protein